MDVSEITEARKSASLPGTGPTGCGGGGGSGWAGWVEVLAETGCGGSSLGVLAQPARLTLASSSEAPAIR